jgi:predicted nucleotidyltransferase
MSLPDAVSQIYAELIAASQYWAHELPQDCHVYLHGSAISNDFAYSAADLAPLSDIDLLVIAPRLSDLEIAAGRSDQLSSLAKRKEFPLLKFGFKFRLMSEISEEWLTLNESRGLVLGRELRGRQLNLPIPLTIEWWKQQVAVATSTRTYYDKNILIGLPPTIRKSDYLRLFNSKRILCTALLVSKQTYFTTPNYRLAAELALGNGIFYDELASTVLRWAQDVRYGMEARKNRHLTVVTKELLLRIDAAYPPLDPKLSMKAFWNKYRPLDVRDAKLLKLNQKLDFLSIRH